MAYVVCNGGRNGGCFLACHNPSCECYCHGPDGNTFAKRSEARRHAERSPLCPNPDCKNGRVWSWVGFEGEYWPCPVCADTEAVIVPADAA